MTEWYWEKNNHLGFIPNAITYGSHKKVWWKCSKGHFWQAEIKSRVNGSGCRFCAGQGVTNEKALSTVFPKIAKEWDFERNAEFRPDNITYGSKQKVYWICPNGHSYKATVSNRTLGKGCPYCCHNPKVNPDNNFAIKYPTLASEWNYEINGGVSPKDITPHTNKKYWWICKNSHSYSASANNRANGYNCPYCSGQKLTPERSLAFVNPRLAKEYDHKKNKESASEVAVGSNKFAWWKCDRGHEWRAKINNRNNGRGCPECAKGLHSSFPEQAVFHFVKSLFFDAINGYKYNKSEIDIYIPQLKIGIEYDGEYYHRTEHRLQKDLEKNQKLYDAGIILIRIREGNCIPMKDDKCIIYPYTYTSDYRHLNEVIKNVLTFLCDKTDITNNIIVNVNNVRNKIISELSSISFENNLAYRNRSISQEWDYRENYPLTPKMFLPNSVEKVHWVCKKCGYKWKAQIKSRCSGCGCPRCAKCCQYTTIEWIEKAKEIHGNKYDYSKAIYINSKTKLTIICPIHGEFEQAPSEHLGGKGCKYCAGQALHPINCLTEINPQLASEWDYDKNTRLPSSVGKSHNEKFWWKCNFGKSHSYLAYVQQRLRGTACAVCAGRQVSYETSVAYLRPDLAKEWYHEKNTKSPEEVSLGSEKPKIWWKCDNPDHKPYLASVYNRAHLHSRCPECSGNKKSHTTFEKEAFEKFPHIDLLCEYQKSSVRIICKCQICNHEWSPFPYNFLKGKGCPNCSTK